MPQLLSPQSRATSAIVEASIDLLTALMRDENAHLKNEPLLDRWVVQMIEAVGFARNGTKSVAK